MKSEIKASFAIASSDGKKIYFLENADQERSALALQRLVAYDVETQQREELFKGPMQAGEPRFALSPDERQIAFEVSDAQSRATTLSIGNAAPVGAIYLVPTSGGPVRELGSPATRRIRPVGWSPDGKSVLSQRGNGHLWWVPIDGGESSQIGSGVFPLFESMNPDQKQVALTQASARQPLEIWVDPDLIHPKVEAPTGNIYVVQMDPGTGQLRGPAAPLTDNSAGTNCAPAWSPDGKSIAFNRPGPATPNGQRPRNWVVRSRETGAEKIYPVNGNTGQCRVAPVWFHDGKTLLNGSFLVQGANIFRTELETGQSTGLGILSYNPAAALSLDDKTLYLTAHDQTAKTTSIIAVDLASKEQRRIWVSPMAVDPNINIPLRLALSPDGRSLALVLSEGTKSRLIRVGTDGSGYRELHSAEGSGAAGAALSRSGLVWSRDGRALFFMDADASGQRLLRISADGSGKPQFTGLTIPSVDVVFDLSPDGRNLAIFSPRPPKIAATGSR